MSEAFNPDEAKASPERGTILRSLGIGGGVDVPDRVLRIVETAAGWYEALTDPRGIYAELSTSEFEPIHRGEGLNEPRTPLGTVFPRADRLALFAVTLGDSLSRRIAELFDRNEPALGYVLDAIASDRADVAAESAGNRFLHNLVERNLVSPATRVLAYSPGYCGWHITGQRELFRFLRPEQIGITLNASCLMQPLKSVSGVLVAGPAEIHDFVDDFDFCDSCATHQCRARIASVAEGTTGADG
jgi:hypothetical protein